MNSTLALPYPDLKLLPTAIGHPIRWRMLHALATGEPQTISEVAAAAGCSYDNAIRHLAVLKKAGLVVQERGKLYQIPKKYLPTPGERTLDLGHCLLWLDAAG